MNDFSSGQRPTFIDAVSRQEVTGQLFERVFASGTISTTESPIWSGGSTYEFIDTPEIVNVVSDNLNDTLAGTGAQKIKIIGFDAGIIKSEIVDLNGTTPVATTNSYDFVHRMFVVQAGVTSPVIPAIAGSVGAAGTIISTGVTSSAVRAVIASPANGVSLHSQIRVPEGETWQIHDITISAGKGQEVTLRTYIRIPLTNIFIAIGEGQLIQSSTVIPAHRTLPSGTDLIFTGVTSAGTVEVSVLVQMTRQNATTALV